MIDIKRVYVTNYLSVLVIVLFLCLGIFMAGAKDTKNNPISKGEKTSVKKNNPRENLTGKPVTPQPISKSKSASPTGAPSLTGTYRVKAGDSLYTIARKYGVTVSSIMKANGLQSTLIYTGQNLKIPGQNSPVPTKPSVNPTNPWVIMVSKSSHILDIYYQNQKWGSYHVELGDGGSGDKQVAGDHKTPEGTFYITEKSILTPEDEFLGTRWLRLSYPNAEDAARGLQQGLISQAEYNQILTAINQKQTPPQKTALGGGVGIHGGDKPEFNPNWTWGCVGLTNRNIEEFFNNIPVGTTVIIQK